ncbi:hypothetical protein P7C73_g4023, partial [Tremellales sp. Uapishka_1]
MSVVLNPSSQLGFNRPLTNLSKKSLSIHNPNSHPIAFKVKTTAPKQYCVRPNSGRVEPGETVDVQVLLQPLAADPPPHAKCKDKFLVQSAYITPDEEMRSLGEMWSQTEKENKSAIHEQKIKCVYLAPEDGVVNGNGIPEEEEIHAGDQSKFLEESQVYTDGYSKWTVHPDKEYDPTLFRNGGYSYWVIEPPARPYIPKTPARPNPTIAAPAVIPNGPSQAAAPNWDAHVPGAYIPFTRNETPAVPHQHVGIYQFANDVGSFSLPPSSHLVSVDNHLPLAVVVRMSARV